MHIAESGAAGKPPLLLLHGGGVAGWMWQPTIGHLGEQARVIVPDLPGHGGSATENYRSHAETCRALIEILEERAPQGAMVVGFSLGAQLALLIASSRPDLVTDVVAVSAQTTPLPFPNLTLALLGATAPLARQAWFAKLQAKELFIPDELMNDYIRDSARISRRTLIASVGENIRFTLPAGWSQSTGPALVLVGGRERKLMLNSAKLTHEARRGSDIQTVDDCGHGIPLQRPQLFADILAGRLSRS